MKIPFNICLYVSHRSTRVLGLCTLTSPKKVWRGPSHNWPRETLMKLYSATSLCPLTTHGTYITLLRQLTKNFILWVDYPYGHRRSQSRTCKQIFSSKKNKKSGCTVNLDLLSADNSRTVWCYRYRRPFVNKYQSFPVVYASASILALHILIVYWTLLSPKKVWQRRRVKTAKKASQRPLSFGSNIRQPSANSVGISVLNYTLDSSLRKYAHLSLHHIGRYGRSSCSDFHTGAVRIIELHMLTALCILVSKLSWHWKYACCTVTRGS